MIDVRVGIVNVLIIGDLVVLAIIVLGVTCDGLFAIAGKGVVVGVVVIAVSGVTVVIVIWFKNS